MTWTEHNFLSQFSEWKPPNIQQLDLEKKPPASHPGILTVIHSVSWASMRAKISNVVLGTNFQVVFFFFFLVDGCVSQKVSF